MEITVSELQELAESEYILVDIRSAVERAYGVLPGAIAKSSAELVCNHKMDKDKKIVVYSAKGEEYLGTVTALREQGYDAVGLKGGYSAWVSSELGKQADNDFQKKVEKSLQTKFRVKILSKFVKAIKAYDLIQAGDKIAVCISGGKDSMLMAKLFQELARFTEIQFETEFIVMDPGYNSENRRLIEHNAEILGVPITIFESNIFESVYNIEKSPCYLCARMRRGYLYNFAKQLGCNKIALGHHYDDVIETILMGMLYGAQIQTMMPKLHSANFEGMELIRPMYLIREEAIKEWRDSNGLHFLQCACRFTDACANSSDGINPSKRQEIKELIKELKKTNPGVEQCIFKSVENVNLNTIIAYKKDNVKHSFLDNYKTE